MNTKTSCFNRKIFLQNIMHALPFIGIFTFITLYIPLVELQNAVRTSTVFHDFTINDSIMRSTLLDTICLTGVQFLFVCYSFACAVWCFRYLFVHRLCKTMHALPLSRNCLFITNVLSGIALLLLPFLTGSIVLCIYLLAHGFSVGCTFMWFLLTFAYCLFFFGLAVFTIMLSGHLVAIPVIYFILNFGFAFLEAVFSEFASSFFYGITGQSFYDMSYATLSPFLNILVNLNYDWETYTLSPKGIQLVVIYAVFGILLCVVSLFFYRRRMLEKQGDPIVSKKLQPFIHYFCTILGGSILAILFSLLCIFNNESSYLSGSEKILFGLFFLLGSAISYYLLKMLLYKTLRVFKLGNKGLGLYLIISTLALFCISFDFLGIETYQPEASEIAFLNVDFDNYHFETDDKEEIKQFLSLHKQLINEKETITSREAYEYYYSLTLIYTTKDGTTLTRMYLIPDLENNKIAPLQTIYRNLYDILDNKTFLFQHLSLDVSDIEFINISENEYTNEANSSDSETFSTTTLESKNYAGLLEAIKQDVSDGKMKLYLWMKPDIPKKDLLYTIDIHCQLDRDHDYYGYMSLIVTKDCVHTLKYMKENKLDEPNTSESNELVD